VNREVDQANQNAGQDQEASHEALPQLDQGLRSALAEAGDSAVKRMAHAGGTERLDVGGTGHTEGYGYENGMTALFEAHPYSAVGAAKEVLARHEKQPSVILNEISIKLATNTTKHGEAYRLWVVELVRALAAGGKKVVVCSALNSDPHVLSLFHNLGEIAGVRLAMETQVTGHDNPTTIHAKLEKTIELLKKAGVPKEHLIHVANLAHTPHGKGFGSQGVAEKTFDANVRTEVAEARKLGYSGVLGYGFFETKRTIEAWNAAWASHGK
jgi:hypothetical protein